MKKDSNIWKDLKEGCPGSESLLWLHLFLLFFWLYLHAVGGVKERLITVVFFKAVLSPQSVLTPWEGNKSAL